MRGYARVGWSVVFVGLLVAVALGAAGTGSSAGSGQPRWVVTDLGKDCSLAAINDSGQIVGQCWKGGKSRAFVWQNGKTTDLGTLEADLQAEPSAINARGQIIGSCVRFGPVGNTDGVVKSVAFLWEIGLWDNGRMIKLGGRMIKLGNLSPVAINDRGQIIGIGVGHGVLWQNGKMTDLGNLEPVAINDRGQIIGEAALLWENGRTRDLRNTLGGPVYEDSAAAINDQGQIVGAGHTAKGTTHAFLWQKGKMVDLGTLRGDDMSEAAAINDRGQIVGQSFSSNPASPGGHPFLWKKGQMIDLGTLGGKSPFVGGSSAWLATAGAGRVRGKILNDRGQIIGGSYTKAGEQHAFVWERGRMTDLGTLGGDKSQAFAINEHNQIVGTSTTKTGQTHAVLWTLRSGA